MTHAKAPSGKNADFEWYTPCGQLLAARVSDNGALVAHIFHADGTASDLPELAQAHLAQWFKSHQLHNELLQRVTDRRAFIQSSLARVDDEGKKLMKDGLASYYDELHRTTMNAANMKTIRDVAIQRALVAVDKAMVAQTPAHGHFAPVVALGRSTQVSKTDY